MALEALKQANQGLEATLREREVTIASDKTAKEAERRQAKRARCAVQLVK